jgi:hypothetical protein
MNLHVDLCTCPALYLEYFEGFAFGAYIFD